MAALGDLAERIEDAAAALTELRPAIERGEPWPLTDVYAPGPESSWGPREVLAHVAEMLPFWMGEIELIIDAGVSAKTAATDATLKPAGEPPGFGRLEDDPLRVQVIGRDRSFPTRELLGRIEVEGGRVARRLRGLDDAEAACIGRHVTRGDLTVRQVVERLIVGHLEGHVTQLREILDTVR